MVSRDFRLRFISTHLELDFSTTSYSRRCGCGRAPWCPRSGRGRPLNPYRVVGGFLLTFLRKELDSFIILWRVCMGHWSGLFFHGWELGLVHWYCARALSRKKMDQSKPCSGEGMTFALGACRSAMICLGLLDYRPGILSYEAWLEGSMAGPFSLGWAKPYLAPSFRQSLIWNRMRGQRELSRVRPTRPEQEKT